MQPEKRVGGLRLLVLDRQPEVLAALPRALTREPLVEGAYSAEVARAEEVAPVLSRHDPHAVVIDPRGLQDVFSRLLCLRRKSSAFVVVAHVSYVDVAEEAEALMAGCALYCLKGMRSAELVRRIADAVMRELPAERWR